MLSEDDVRKLVLRKSESPGLDYKEGFAWTAANRDKKYELVRDLIAMANTRDGGRVVFGVRNGDFELVGVSDDIYNSIDPNNAVQMAHDNSAPAIKCEILKHTIEGHRVIVFDVAEFDDTPIICTRGVQSTEGRPRLLLREGAIYVRTAAAATEEVKSPDDMRSLIARAVAKKRDALLGDIQSLLTGRATSPSVSATEKYAAELDAAQKLFSERLGAVPEGRGFMEVVAYPTEYAKRIPTITDASAAVRQAEVRLRGWTIPHTKPDNAGAFGSGVESWNVSTTFVGYFEAYRLYQSGLFISKQALWEDVDGRTSESGRKALSFISAIWSFTEYLLFLSRLYEASGYESTVHVRLALHGCRDRELAAFDVAVAFWPGKVSREDVIVTEEDVRAVELRADFGAIAARMVKHVFHVFNWDDVTDELITHWQQRLLNRQF